MPGGEGKVNYIPSSMHFEEAITSSPTVRTDVFIRLGGIGSHPPNDFKYQFRTNWRKSPTRAADSLCFERNNKDSVAYGRGRRKL